MIIYYHVILYYKIPELSGDEYNKLFDKANEHNQKLWSIYKEFKQKKLKEYSINIFNDINNKKLSRFAFIFDESEHAQKSHRDIHSFIILGKNKEKDDILIIEKEEPGESVTINKLSSLIENLLGCLPGANTLNLPTKSIKKFYP